MTIYSTKTALTKGIEKVEVYEGSVGDWLYPLEPGRFDQFKLGVNAFERRADAEKKAEEMRERKIESLCKQIDKLRRMTFDS